MTLQRCSSCIEDVAVLLPLLKALEVKTIPVTRLPGTRLALAKCTARATEAVLIVFAESTIFLTLAGVVLLANAFVVLVVPDAGQTCSSHSSLVLRLVIHQVTGTLVGSTSPALTLY